MKRAGTIGAAVLMLSLGLVVFAANSAQAATTTYYLTLNGANVVPPQSSYTGTGTITVDDVANQVCITSTLNNTIDPTMTAGLFLGGPTVNGTVVVDFAASRNTCINSVPPADIAAIKANPTGYYVEITFLSDVKVRSQLSQTPPTTTTAPTSSTSTTTSTIVTTTTVAPVSVSPRFTG
jgi:hypothetical protein